jgi:hypothetical protein
MSKVAFCKIPHARRHNDDTHVTSFPFLPQLRRPTTTARRGVSHRLHKSPSVCAAACGAASVPCLPSKKTDYFFLIFSFSCRP